MELRRWFISDLGLRTKHASQILTVDSSHPNVLLLPPHGKSLSPRWRHKKSNLIYLMCHPPPTHSCCCFRFFLSTILFSYFRFPLLLLHLKCFIWPFVCFMAFLVTNGLPVLPNPPSPVLQDTLSPWYMSCDRWCRYSKGIKYFNFFKMLYSSSLILIEIDVRWFLVSSG